ncbi:MAG: hypothetical protein WC015_02450 [Methanoregula sp.]|jgi:flagellar protein FlaF
MAVAEIIGTAIGVMIMIIVAYLVVGGILVAGETVANAQKDLTLSNEARLRTGIELTFSDIKTAETWLNFNVTNTGSEVITDFDQTDVLILNSSLSGYQHNTYEPTDINYAGTWRNMGIYYGTTLNNPENIHPGELDPGEKMWVCATYTGERPNWFQFTTSNGVSVSTTV